MTLPISKHSWSDPRYSKRTKHFGLYDTVDHLWMGDDEGPVTYVDRTLARVAQEMATYQLQWPWSRIQVKRFHNKKSWRKRDDVPTVRQTTLRWLERKEAGTIP